MARTVKEIKNEMAATFCKERAVISAYGLDVSKTFDQQFSPVSIESILFYAFAFAVWVLENLFDAHSAEVDERIERLEPHTLRWYVTKAKAFMFGTYGNGQLIRLVTDTDYYDTSSMSETDIENARVVKFANASEDNTVVYMKVAGADDSGNPCKLSESQFAAFKAYINTIKDAGVAIVVRNEEADLMRLQLKVFYNPMLMNAQGVDNEGKHIVNDTIRNVVASLPFNGVFRNSDLLAAINALPAVEVVHISSVQAKAHDAQEWHNVEGYDKPYSGYYSVSDTDIVIEYQEYKATDYV